MCDNILNNTKYYIHTCLDQCDMAIRVEVVLRDDPSKFAQKCRYLALEQCHWDSYRQIVNEMAKECIKELENG